MKFIVARIEDDIASLESIDTGEIINYNVSDIPFKIYEGDIIIFEENVWSQNFEQKEIIKSRIEEKMNRLWED